MSKYLEETVRLQSEIRRVRVQDKTLVLVDTEANHTSSPLKEILLDTLK